jgi:hypothetical protein
MKMAMFANWLGAMSRLSVDLGFLIKVKILSLWIMFRDYRAVINSPTYSAIIVFEGITFVDTM